MMNKGASFYARGEQLQEAESCSLTYIEATSRKNDIRMRNPLLENVEKEEMATASFHFLSINSSLFPLSLSPRRCNKTFWDNHLIFLIIKNNNNKESFEMGVKK